MTRSSFRFYLIGFAALLCCGILLFRGCGMYDKHKKIKYYSDQENYIEASGKIAFYDYSEESQILYIGFTDLEPYFSNWSYLDFKIVGKNVDILTEREIENKIHIGDTVHFTAAPGFFGDGYIIPIVGLAAEEEVLLEFDEGYENLLAWLEQ